MASNQTSCISLLFESGQTLPKVATPGYMRRWPLFDIKRPYCYNRIVKELYQLRSCGHSLGKKKRAISGARKLTRNYIIK